ncbi:TetR/AcrR family transcriptional regulator [Pseudomonas petrae]|uniref:TetR/AcrR family transcriptional regulator n=1 Tax=Pseudomonas petrae TaxID=2912190 RepID=A0ABS9IEC8_9PSED|nr:TetR/AcrR family transcriptional regulator [Pseudomonas petrae]MCF7545433.1 TetR/AcrR family transcriptional regulator [Pseudomonas petrae]
MRYPAAETAEKHERILEQASALFRQRGFSGVSLSEIMKATGLTHGSFYNHFDSKDALISKSLGYASRKSLAGLNDAKNSPESMVAYTMNYLSLQHRDEPENGCLMAALGTEVGREPAARAGFTAHLKISVERFAVYFPWSKKRNKRRNAIRTLSTLIGAVMLARAVDDPAFSDEILREVRAEFE